MKKTILYLVYLLLAPAACFAQQHVTLQSELGQLSDLSLLSAYRSGTIEAGESTYDRTGGNNDGSGEGARKNPDGSLVMLDIDGPGVLNRFATPTPTTDTLDFYIDHSPKPVLSICYMDLFNGKVYPFTAPLCGSAVGGYFSYFPILFRQHLEIVCRGKKLQYHQLGYRLFPKGTIIKSFNNRFDPAGRQALARVAASWSNQGLTGKISTLTVNVAPGQSRTVWQVKKGGRLTGLAIDTADTENLRLQIYWDGDTTPAIDCPLRFFFGYAFGTAGMQGLFSGTNSRHYCYFPMPFDKSAKIIIINEGQAGVTVHTSVGYLAKKRNAQTEGRFYAHYQSEHLTKADPHHVFLDIKGKGHYVGTLLRGIGNYKGMTGFWEGDDTTATDGIFRIHGTGTEDYFNGGWYDVKGRWEHAESRPLSGCLGYGRTPAHTGGFRFLVSDKIPFEHSFYSAIEHGGSAKYGEPADYTSLVFYYCDRGTTAQQTKIN
jgi:hypothetical protein